METLVKIGLFLAVIGGLFVSEQAYERHLIAKGDTAGYSRAKGEWAASEASIKADAEAKAGKKTKEAEAKTDKLQKDFDTLADDRQKDKAKHETDKNRAVANALAGRERLRNPDGSTCGALSRTENGQGAEAGAGTSPAKGSDLMPETAATILSIAGDTAQIVRDFNTVLDRYQRIEAACNERVEAAK